MATAKYWDPTAGAWVYLKGAQGPAGPQGPAGAAGAQGPAGAPGSTVASGVSFTPTGLIASTNVQAALAEVDAEKVAGPAVAVDGNVSLFDGTTGKLIKDGGVPLTTLTNKINRIGTSTDKAIATWNGTTGGALQNTGVIIDASNNMTTPGTIDGRDVSVDGTKLDGIASGATANATDAQLRDRSTHTGTQLKATISDFTHTHAAADIASGVVDLSRLGTTPAAGEFLKAGGASGSADWVPASTIKTDLALTKADVGLGSVPNVDTTNASNITTGTLPSAVLPPLAVNEVFTVTSQAAMLALTAQRGDMAIRTDNGKTYVLSVDAPTVLANWQEVMATGQVVSVASKTGVVTLVKGDVGLGSVDNTADSAKPVSTAQQTALDAKQPLDADLTAIAALAPPNDDFIQRKSGVWVNRTAAQVKTDLALTKGDVGLGSVDNTTDLAKPISTLVQSALNLKIDLTQKAAASGVASLDASTKIPIAQIPTGTSSTTVALGNDARLSDARVPTAHSHLIADLPVAPSGTSNTTQVVRADDSRLSNARTPTGAAGGDFTGTYPNPTIAFGHIVSEHLVDGEIYANNLADAAVTLIKMHANTKDQAAATASMRTLGTSATSAAAGNDARLSDARTPIAHTHVATTDLTATGTKNAGTFLRGDNTWATPPAGGGMTVYKQPSEPVGAPIGSVWVDTDEPTSAPVLVLTQAAYDALGTPDPATVYVVT